MTDDQWLASASPAKMLAALRAADRPSPRKLRLFACACVRRLHRPLAEVGLLPCVEVAEAFADGAASKPARLAAERRAQQALDEGAGTAAVAAMLATRARLAPVRVAEYAGWAVMHATRDESAWRREEAAEQVAQAALLRECFGDSLSVPTPAALAAAWGGTRRPTPAILSLAQAAYEERDLPSGALDPVRLSILADALEEAGYADTNLLTHLRSRSPHVRGCWALDLVLGKE